MRKKEETYENESLQLRNFVSSSCILSCVGAVFNIEAKRLSLTDPVAREDLGEITISILDSMMLASSGNRFLFHLCLK
jgi:hypothetical protein